MRSSCNKLTKLQNLHIFPGESAIRNIGAKGAVNILEGTLDAIIEENPEGFEDFVAEKSRF